MHAVERAQVVIPSGDLEDAIAFYCGTLGFRLDMIMPADAPRVAVVTAAGLSLRLELAGAGHSNAPLTLRLSGDAAWLAGFDRHDLDAPDGVRILLANDEQGAAMPLVEPDPAATLRITRAGEGTSATGRAGMVYRDLIPGRLGGRYIASHITIPDGGPVPDYVHYHRVRFQLIYCLRGWVRVVYEDQGDPFVMHAGDCVLQPPTIRHRVLEASPGLEVLEIGGPADHETLREHGFDLPTPEFRPQRDFAGQRFVRHVANQACWAPMHDCRFQCRDTGIANATDEMAHVRVLRTVPDALPATRSARVDARRLGFLAVLHGHVTLEAGSHGTHQLGAGDTCVIPPGMHYVVASDGPCEYLDVTLPSAEQASR